MNKVWSIASFLMIASLTMGTGASGLASNVLMPEQVVIPQNATPVERVVAIDLARYLGKITGRTFAVVAEPVANSKPGFYIGRTTGSKDALTKLQSLPHNDQTSLLRVAGKSVVLVGMTDEALSHGVYSLLHDLGCRWYMPQEWGEYVPRINPLKLKAGDKTYAPAFLYRFVPYNHMQVAYRVPLEDLEPKIKDPATGTKDVENMMMAQWVRRNRFGGVYTIGAPGHNYGVLVPREKYQQDHPEYYALISGKRSQERYAQLCTTNPDVRRIAAETVLAWIREGRGANPMARMVCVCPEDTEMFCQCENCLKEREGGHGVAESIAAFANYVARKVKEQYPDFYVVTYANYYSSEAPLKTKLEPNVMPWITQWGVDQSKPVTQQDRTMAAIRGWGASGNPLYMYTYYAWGPVLWPMAQNIGVDIPYFYKHGARYFYTEWFPNWGLQHLNMFMTAELLWNPKADVNKLFSDYYKHFYGPAAQPMREFNEIAARNAADRGAEADVYQHAQIWSPDVLDRMESKLAEAKALLRNADAIYSKRLAGIDMAFQIGKQYLASYHALEDYYQQGGEDRKQHALQTYEKFNAFFADPQASYLVDRDSFDRGLPPQSFADLKIAKDWTCFGGGEFDYEGNLASASRARGDAKSRNGFLYGRWGLELAPKTDGEMIYRFHCVPGTKFGPVDLTGLYVYSPQVRFAVSTDSGSTWTTVMDGKTAKGDLTISLSNIVTGKSEFLLRCTATNPSDKTVLMIQWFKLKGKVGG